MINKKVFLIIYILVMAHLKKITTTITTPYEHNRYKHPL